jgi:hypothetical protein
MSNDNRISAASWGAQSMSAIDVSGAPWFTMFAVEREDAFYLMRLSRPPVVGLTLIV